MAAAAVVATGPRNQFERVVPLDQTFNDEDYAGKHMYATHTHFSMNYHVLDNFQHCYGCFTLYHGCPTVRESIHSLNLVSPHTGGQSMV